MKCEAKRHVGNTRVHSPLPSRLPYWACKRLTLKRPPWIIVHVYKLYHLRTFIRTDVFIRYCGINKIVRCRNIVCNLCNQSTANRCHAMQTLNSQCRRGSADADDALPYEYPRCDLVVAISMQNLTFAEWEKQSISTQVVTLPML